MEHFHLSETATGAVIAATITSLISFLGLLISKDQKVSEFRQDWINNLRAEISELIGQIYNLMDCRHGESQTNNAEEFWKHSKDHYIIATKCLTSIRLRLNPEEKSHAKFLALLKEFETEFETGKMPALERLIEIENKFLPEAQRVIKTEWKKVKRGELLFLLTKFMFLTFLLLGISTLLFPDLQKILSSIDESSKINNNQIIEVPSPEIETKK